MLGYSKDEMMGMGNKQYTDQEERKKLYQAFNQVYKTGEPTKEFDWEVIRKDGTKRYIEASISLIKNSSGQPTGFRGIVRDVTERKRMEQERIKTEKLQSIGILAGGLAHDFNNLLTSILGNIDFAKSFVKRGDKIFDLLERAEKSSLRASDLTKQLITFSKGGAPVRRTVSIGNILQSATSFTLAGSNVISAFHMPNDLWPVQIDEGQVRQVIHSIVLNARDAMPEGGAVFLSVENVTVNLKNELLLREGNYVRISIKDEGIGIPAENIPKIFDPYFTTKEMGSQKGMGLGLSVCHSIVKNHHGSITVESKVGVGTTFHIYLPVSPEKVEEERGEAKISRRKRVLVMDDEKEVRKILEEVLKDEGYEAAFAADGSEAINLYQEAKEAQRPFDAVILDLTVPGGMSGKETIKRLLEMDPEVKAIVSSGYHKDPIMLKFKEYGFKVALPKPYKISTLKRVLLEVTG
jgi:PAS domain S-box-containing protein